MTKELFLPQDVVQKEVQRIATQISEDYEDQDLIMIGVLNGAIFFMTDLVRQIKIPLKIDFIRAASYGSEMESSGTIRLTKDIEVDICGKHVILVEDIVDSGRTLSMILEKVKSKNPASVRVCVLIDKHERRELKIPLDYSGFRVEEGFIVGYGLDFNEAYRHLPDIYLLK